MRASSLILIVQLLVAGGCVPSSSTLTYPRDLSPQNAQCLQLRRWYDYREGHACERLEKPYLELIRGMAVGDIGDPNLCLDLRQGNGVVLELYREQCAIPNTYLEDAVRLILEGLSTSYRYPASSRLRFGSDVVARVYVEWDDPRGGFRACMFFWCENDVFKLDVNRPDERWFDSRDLGDLLRALALEYSCRTWAGSEPNYYPGSFFDEDKPR